MNRETREQRKPKPVKRIEISEKFSKRRLILAIFFAVLGIGAIVYAIASSLKTESGWKTIETSSSAETNYSSDFSFSYNLGQGELSASEEYKKIQTLYTDAMVKCYKIFHNIEEFEDVNNICYINKHPNEELVVDETLYHALEQVNKAKSRLLYFGPVYEQYTNLFHCKDDSETINFDPYQNEEIASYFSEIAMYANNPEEIDLKLLDNNKIILFVSADYLSYADETGFSNFIDFSFMKNAVIIDYVADLMQENDYTAGSITSYDGFTRNLDNRGTSYTYTIFDRVGQTVYTAASMQYKDAQSIVFLYNYKLSDKDKNYRYELKNGEIRTPYIDETDGLCKSSTNNLLAYSKEKGCFEILLQILPIFTRDTFEKDQLNAIKQNGIYSIYGSDHVLYYNEPDLILSDFYQNNEITYTSILNQ